MKGDEVMTCTSSPRVVAINLSMKGARSPQREEEEEGRKRKGEEGRKRRTYNLSPNQISQPKTIPHFNLIPLSQSNICQSNHSSEIFIRFWDWFVI
jgi:hypothetical protein